MANGELALAPAVRLAAQSQRQRRGQLSNGNDSGQQFRAAAALFSRCLSLTGPSCAGISVTLADACSLDARDFLKMFLLSRNRQSGHDPDC